MNAAPEGEASAPSPVSDEQVTALITADGYLRLPGPFCRDHFPSDRCAALRRGGTFMLMPATVYAPAALIMKQRTAAGERSTLIREVWGDDHPVGEVTAIWQPARRRLIIDSSERADAGTRSTR